MYLQSQRLSIRDMQASDAEFMLALLNTKGFIQNIGDRQVRSIEQALDKIKTTYTLDYPTHGLFTVVEQTSNTPIGTVSYLKRSHLLYDDIGYAFLPEHQGKGYAFEATRCLLEHVIAQGVNTVLAVVNPDNLSSIKLLEKLNFKLIGQTTMEGDTKVVAKYQYSNKP